ncbi:MAG: sulfatase-like hydrolase/transferase [Candidatus Omnitrophica bacterium]|nr:sulfatase-like hydrolase/transferase [Candidatus Omnitrophota bacterium]
MRQKFNIPFHPFLFAIYYFLHLQASNLQEQIEWKALALPVAAALGLITLIWFLLNLFLKDKTRSALLTSVIGFLFFSYGHIHGLLSRLFPVSQEALLIILGMILLITGFFIFKHKKPLNQTTIFLNLMSFLLCLMALVSIISYNTKHSEMKKALSKQIINQPAEPRRMVPGSENFPDVYYIILDEYAHPEVLQRVYHYDNSDFMNYLNDKGFYVSANSHANYLRTILSLPSSLNMQYLNFMTQKLGPDSTDTALPYAMLRGNNVARQFRNLGYQYVLMHSGEAPSDTSPLMDLQIKFGFEDELASTLAKGTLLKKAAADFMHRMNRKKHFYNFSEVAKIPEIKGPTFTFAHFVLPHSPFVFDRNGDVPNTESFSLQNEDYGDDYPRLYLDQLVYTNVLVKRLIDTLIEKSERPPIIILQSDHGNIPTGEWRNDDEFISERTRILNAYYVPDEVKEKLYPTISPVNSFRLLFKEYFNLNYELLPDKTYYAHNEEHCYAFTDITEIAMRTSQENDGLLATAGHDK